MSPQVILKVSHFQLLQVIFIGNRMLQGSACQAVAGILTRNKFDLFGKAVITITSFAFQTKILKLRKLIEITY